MFPIKFAVAVMAATLLAGVTLAEPANLAVLKRDLRAYHDRGDYEREIAAVVNQARTWVEKRSAQRKPGERLAMVFDVDETLLSNWPLMDGEDFGGSDAAWNAWYEAAKAPAVAAVCELFRFVRNRGVDIAVISGRPEAFRGVTEKNLRAVGCGDFVVFVCRADGAQGPVAAFKTAQRKRLADEGWTIIANIGDQQSDLVNGFAERTFKLPNPFYLLE